MYRNYTISPRRRWYSAYVVYIFSGIARTADMTRTIWFGMEEGRCDDVNLYIWGAVLGEFGRMWVENQFFFFVFCRFECKHLKGSTACLELQMFTLRNSFGINSSGIRWNSIFLRIHSGSNSWYFWLLFLNPFVAVGKGDCLIVILEASEGRQYIHDVLR